LNSNFIVHVYANKTLALQLLPLGGDGSYPDRDTFTGLMGLY